MLMRKQGQAPLCVENRIILDCNRLQTVNLSTVMLNLLRSKVTGLQSAQPH